MPDAAQVIAADQLSPQSDHWLEKLMHARYSARAFHSTPVPRATIVRILELAQRAPSWCNTQPWQLRIVSGDALETFRTALFDHAQQHAQEVDLEIASPVYEGTSLERRRAAGWGLYEAVGIARGDRAASFRQAMENFRFFGAPHVAIVTSDAKLGPYGYVDCGGFLTAFTLAAKAHGVDTIVQAAAVRYGSVVRAHFGVPDDQVLVCGISFGYGDESHPANSFRTERASVSEAVTFLE